MIDKLTPKECALCGSCVDACPTSAITFSKEYLDFSYPSINPEKCIGCNLCEKVCPVISPTLKVSMGEEYPHAHIGRNPDGKIRNNSSSGGVFYALAKHVLSQGGYVCGAVLESDFSVCHEITNEIDGLRKMMGSKYAQSNLTGVYKRIRELLKAGEMVLFTGCPCQVAGLHCFLGKEYQNLITVDLICHGIPSNTMLQAYLDRQRQKHNSEITHLAFRDKSNGWHNSSVKIDFANGSGYCTPIGIDAYMKGFLGATYLKESCYTCRFKNFQSGSDLTLGDFWGAEAERKDLDDNTGLSAITVNSAKGETLLCNSQIGKKFRMRSCNKLYKTELWKDIRFPEGRKYGDDTSVTYRLLDRCSRVGYIQNPYYYYCMRNGSALHTQVSEANLQLFDAYNELIVYMEERHPDMMSLAYYAYSVRVFDFLALANQDPWLLHGLRNKIKNHWLDLWMLKKNTPKQRLLIMLFLVSPNLYKWVVDFYAVRNRSR